MAEMGPVAAVGTAMNESPGSGGSKDGPDDRMWVIPLQRHSTSSATQPRRPQAAAANEAHPRAPDLHLHLLKAAAERLREASRLKHHPEHP
jgi:hypothetical protein